MSTIERGHLSPRDPLNPMSEGENAKTARVLRDDELDSVSGGRVGGKMHLEDISLG
jgi:hypothetical protein